MKRYFDHKITKLSRCEIFVFGSNLQGHHNGGAARLAHQKFGAQWGVGVGPSGQCYAIPTMHGGINDIKHFVDDFIEYARTHPDNRFLVTRIGCGIAGFTDEEMAPLFKEALKLPNVNFSKEWLLILHEDEFIDAFITGIEPPKKVVPVPMTLTENDLIRLCSEYKYTIGSGVKVPLPEIRIRYVIDQGRFGYSNFGDFYMCDDGELYVWCSGDEFKEYHNQCMVEEFFQDECRERGSRRYFHRVIFAGVETPLRDCNGKTLYTGDVIRVWLKGYDGSVPENFDKKNSMLLALGTLGENTDRWDAKYACVLDNHCVTPDMCAKIQRCGTVFYQLDPNEYPITIFNRCMKFQDIYNTSGLAEEDKEVLAEYTPNFDQELWKYHANKTLGIEFNSK